MVTRVVGIMNWAVRGALMSECKALKRGHFNEVMLGWTTRLRRLVLLLLLLFLLLLLQPGVQFPLLHSPHESRCSGCLVYRDIIFVFVINIPSEQSQSIDKCQMSEHSDERERIYEMNPSSY